MAPSSGTEPACAGARQGRPSADRVARLRAHGSRTTAARCPRGHLGQPQALRGRRPGHRLRRPIHCHALPGPAATVRLGRVAPAGCGRQAEADSGSGRGAPWATAARRADSSRVPAGSCSACRGVAPPRSSISVSNQAATSSGWTTSSMSLTARSSSASRRRAPHQRAGRRGPGAPRRCATSPGMHRPANRRPRPAHGGPD